MWFSLKVASGLYFINHCPLISRLLYVLAWAGLGWGAREAGNWDREERADKGRQEYRSGEVLGALGQGARVPARLSEQLLWGLSKRLRLSPPDHSQHGPPTAHPEMGPKAQVEQPRL